MCVCLCARVFSGYQYINIQTQMGDVCCVKSIPAHIQWSKLFGCSSNRDTVHGLGERPGLQTSQKHTHCVRVPAKGERESKKAQE